MAGHIGMRKRRALAPDQERSRMWKSMRGLRRFTTADIEATAEVGKSHARKYVRWLAQAGYLRELQPRDSGRAGGHAIWQLVKNTGPVAPRISKVGLYDANVSEPVPAVDDRPLNRTAPALLRTLRLMVDEIDRAGRELPQRLRELAEQAQDDIERAEGRA